jgi:hypothetical protein
MITKYIVEATTEALALSMFFGALALYGVFAFQDYEARKRKNKHKGR